MSENAVRIAAISEHPLDLAEHLAAVNDPRCGGVVTFCGVVRDHAPDAEGTVIALEYSHHPSAEKMLRDVAEEVLTAHPQTVARVAITHRVGRLAVGELAVVAAVATPHRAEAFAICEELVEQVKQRLPIWKKQETAAGATNWVGLA